MKENIEPIEYYSGIFDKFKNNNNLDSWCDDFPEIMWGLGFDLAKNDCIDKAAKECELK